MEVNNNNDITVTTFLVTTIKISVVVSKLLKEITT
jgi:hypothetical protein